MSCCPFPRRALPVLILIQFVFIVSGFLIPVSEAVAAIPDTVSHKFGSIRFEIEPDTAYLYINDDFNNLIILTDGKELKLPAGNHRLHIFGKELSDRRIDIILVEDVPQLFRLEKPKSWASEYKNSMYAAYMWDANLMLFSDDDTSIEILYTGHHSYGMLKAKLPPGSYRIQFRSAAGRVEDRYVEVNPYELITVENYLKPRKVYAISAGIFPGASQLYKRQNGKAALVFGVVGISAGLAIHFDQKMGSDVKKFNTVFSQYHDARNEPNALALGDQLDQIAGSINDQKRNRNIFRTSAIILYLANIVDAFREPDTGYTQGRPFNPNRDFSVDLMNDVVVATVHIRF
jgi:TM2 domain-containing membrane protein YozV